MALEKLAWGVTTRLTDLDQLYVVFYTVLEPLLCGNTFLPALVNLHSLIPVKCFQQWSSQFLMVFFVIWSQHTVKTDFCN